MQITFSAIYFVRSEKDENERIILDKFPPALRTSWKADLDNFFRSTALQFCKATDHARASCFTTSPAAAVE
jgi:hypothetical protein